MKKILPYILISITILTCLSRLYAVKATPYPISIIQNDGSEITFYLRGNEFFHYKTTLDGYLLTSNTNGILNYAKSDIKGNIVSTNIKASNINKRTIKEHELLQRLVPNVNLSKTSQRQKSMPLTKVGAATIARQNFPLIGAPNSLVILVNFKDKSFGTINPKTAFTNLLNGTGGIARDGTRSAREYFNDNSMGVFNPNFDVVGPFNLLQNMDFYGADDTSGDDKNPQQMVIDACTLAANNGVNFSQYDTDGDGYVDNIFIYYAGYNQAEGSDSNTIWPHRWTLNNDNTKFNGKIIYDYACTSELRGRSNANMCGIGTFVHEFGHVLGLVDYYPTNTAKHHTLSKWNVMDAGSYLNSGLTPPAYSAYDRFQLNWIKPKEIKVPGKYSLQNLTTSNEAYIITPLGNHNLNGEKPSPVEFFTLENRRLTGWDSYLPDSGMLITRIYYNASDWNNNGPNNDPDKMGVDIIEADGIGSDANLRGDTYPGSKYVYSYTPTLSSGIELFYKKLTLITDANGIISFQFMSNDNSKMTIPLANAATDITTGSFIANWDKVTSATGYYLSVYNISNGTSQQTEEFDSSGNTPIGWKISTSKRTISTVYSGKNVPAIQLNNSTDTIVTEEYLLPVTKLSFFIRSLGGLNGLVRVEGKNENVWTKIDSIPVNITLNTVKSYTLLNTNYKQFRLAYKKGTGDVAIDDITVHFNKKLEFNLHEEWTTSNSYALMNLIPNREYLYKVRASQKLFYEKKILFYENYSDFSNTVNLTTLENTIGNVFRLQNDGSIKILIPNKTLTIRVYNILGQLVREIKPITNVFYIDGLPKGQVFILQAGEYKTKIIL